MPVQSHSMFDSPLITALLILFLVLLCWYLLGMQYNIRRERRALRWMENGLPIIGEKAALDWSGVSHVEIQVPKAKEPFRSADVVIDLVPREIPLWWFWRKNVPTQDTIIVRAQLRTAPRFDLVSHSPHVPADEQLKRSGTGQWTAVQGGLANAMSADIRGNISPYTVNRLIVQTTLEGMTLTRLIVHRSAPNLEVHYLLPQFEQVSSLRVFTGIHQLGEEVAQV
ncbi:MAG: hypothetical protein EYC68_05705 [Chloroflexota bacterium]|nr:MAG: hypothetical protein EYC68_05705 [Chloroflexota bacterium]